MTLEAGDHQQAHQGRGEAAVVQAHGTVEFRHRGDHAVVHHGRNHAIAPAVAVGDGAQAVGVAQAHDDGLGIEVLVEGAAGVGSQQAEDPGSHRIAQHDGPDVAGMGAGVAGSQHAENDTEGNTVELRTDQAIVEQDEQAVDAHIHQHGGIVIGIREIDHMIRVPQQVPVLLRGAAHQPSHHNKGGEQDDAEQLGDQSGSHGQTGDRIGHCHAHGPVQDALHQEGRHANRQRGGIQVEALVDDGRIAQAGG